MTGHDRVPRASPEQVLDQLVRDLADAHGLPRDDDEFPEVVAAYSDLWRAVIEIDAIPIDEAIQPAPAWLRQL